MAFCAECGAPLASDARFCVECGATVASLPTTPPPLDKIRTLPPGPLPVAPRSGGGALRFLLAAVVVVVALGLIRTGLREDKPPVSSPSPSGQASSPSASPAAAPTVPAQAASASLLQASGEWTVDPKDPLYSRSESNGLNLHSEGSQLKGVGPENGQFRFWDQGSGIVGEATDGSGKTWKLSWEWLEPGARARMTVSDGQDSHQVTLIRPSAVIVETVPSPTAELPLFQTRGDLNGDGSVETVRILSLVPGASADSSSDKRMEILAADGTVVFSSEVFQEPFRTDFDDMAETPEQKAGLHIVEGKRYPVIRVIFVCRSGNFADFQFNGQTYDLADVGN